MISEVNIFRLFLYNENYRKKVINELTCDLFQNEYLGELLTLVNEYYSKHMVFPLDNIKMLIYNNPLKQPKSVIDEKIEVVDVDIDHYKDMEIDNLLEDTEKWLKQQRFGKLIINGIQSYEDIQDKKKDAIDYLTFYEEFEKIMSFNFDTEIGIDLKNIKNMFNEHKRKDRKLKFHNKYLNMMTKGGCNIPSLNIVAGPPHSGKTRALCSLAADYARSNINNNILYVTLEMSESQIAKYIDYILLDKTEDEVKNMEFDDYKKFKKEKDEKFGKIIIKEYPTSTISTGKIRSLLGDLKNVGFVPNILIVDYIGILRNERNISGKSYEVGKAVSEELRGLAGQNDMIVWTGSQINRTGAQKKDGGNMEDMAESYAINMTGDLIILAINNSTLRSQGKQIFKTVKNRHGGKIDYFLFAEIPENTYKIDFVSSAEHFTMDEDGDNQQYKEKFKKENTSEINNTDNNKFKTIIPIGRRDYGN